MHAVHCIKINLYNQLYIHKICSSDISLEDLAATDNRVRMWRFSDVSGTQSPSSRCAEDGGGITHTQTEARTAGAIRNANPWGWWSYQDGMTAQHRTAYISRDSSWHYQEGPVWLHQNLWLLCCVSQLLCEMLCNQLPWQPLSPRLKDNRLTEKYTQ